jgi:hypothetical protein
MIAVRLYQHLEAVSTILTSNKFLNRLWAAKITMFDQMFKVEGNVFQGFFS